MVNGVVGLNELLSIFEDSVTVADITASKYLGKISAAIVKRRIELHMTQKEFADYVGVSQGMISKWESGDYNFTVRGLAEIAEKIDIELYINFKKRRDNMEVTRLENTDFMCVKSDEKVFVNRKSVFKVIDFKQNRNSNHIDKVEKNNCHFVKERIEM